jgi:hypothetical protein
LIFTVRQVIFCAGLGEKRSGLLHQSGEDHHRQDLLSGEQGRVVWGAGMTEKVVWHVVRDYAASAGSIRDFV